MYPKIRFSKRYGAFAIVYRRCQIRILRMTTIYAYTIVSSIVTIHHLLLRFTIRSVSPAVAVRRYKKSTATERLAERGAVKNYKKYITGKRFGTRACTIQCTQ